MSTERVIVIIEVDSSLSHRKYTQPAEHLVIEALSFIPEDIDPNPCLVSWRIIAADPATCVLCGRAHDPDQHE